MAQRLLERIQSAILFGDYDLTNHAIDEMAEGGLSIFAVEHAVLTGSIKKIESDDVRGPKYTVIGLAEVEEVAAKRQVPERMEMVPVAVFA